MSVKRPAMRYYGGKWILAKWIIKHFPKHRNYVEPFGGAASVLLQKERSYGEVYNDLDGEICNVFEVLRDSADELERLIRLTPYARCGFEQSYQPADCKIEQARRTIFRSFAGFGSGAAMGRNTGFRNDSNRSGSTPAMDWMRFSDHIQSFCERLQGVVIENKCAYEIMGRFDEVDTLHYVDPPYHPYTRDVKAGQGYNFEMLDSDLHGRLLKYIKNLDGFVVLSGYRCAMYDDLLGDWSRIDKAALADGARKRTESLWINPKCVNALNIPRQLEMLTT